MIYNLGSLQKYRIFSYVNIIISLDTFKDIKLIKRHLLSCHRFTGLLQKRKKDCPNNKIKIIAYLSYN